MDNEDYIVEHKFELFKAFSKIITHSTVTFDILIFLGDFGVTSLDWHKDGKSLLLMGKEDMCVCYLQE